MKRIDTFLHADITFAQYLQKVLEDQSIECFVKNDNVALAGLSERAAFDLSPELWVLDDSRADEAGEIVRQIREEGG